MKHFTSSAIVFAFALSCSGTLLAAAMEKNPQFMVDARSGVVKYSDLNLADSADAQVLLGRVEHLARELCERESDIRQLKAIRDRQRCIEESYKKALVVINRQTGVDTEAVAARTAGSRELVAE